MLKKQFICLFFLLLAGCGTTQVLTSDEVLLKTRVEIDPYKKTTIIRSPMLKSYPNWNGDGFSMLRAITLDKYIIYGLYVSDTAERWVNYDRSYDLNGNNFELVEIDKEIVSDNLSHTVCIKEVFNIVLTREYLDKAKLSNLNIKAVGQNGEKIFVLPGYFIDGFLRKVDELKISSSTTIKIESDGVDLNVKERQKIFTDNLDVAKKAYDALNCLVDYLSSGGTRNGLENVDQYKKLSIALSNQKKSFEKIKQVKMPYSDIERKMLDDSNEIMESLTNKMAKINNSPK